MTDEPCTREDLEAVVPKLTLWTVDNDGERVECVADNDDDLQDIESYSCIKCLDCWESWEEALDHLKAEEVSA